MRCPVYSGTPLLWIPWGTGEVSCTVEPLYCGYLRELVRCPAQRGVLDKVTSLKKAYLGRSSVCNTEVSNFSGVL